MKKNLTLRRETLGTLSGPELSRAVGGAPTEGCSGAGATCTSTATATQGCIPPLDRPRNITGTLVCG